MKEQHSDTFSHDASLALFAGPEFGLSFDTLVPFGKRADLPNNRFHEYHPSLSF